MSEMVERMAKAYWNAGPGRRFTWDDETEELHDVVRERIKAAIRAMRMPTAAMLEAGPPEPYMDGCVWCKMIDAALDEKP